MADNQPGVGATVAAMLPSIIRYIIAAIATGLGLEASAGQIDAVTGFASSAALAVGLLVWSWVKNRKAVGK